MRAVVCDRYGPPEVLRPVEIDPPVVRRGQVRVEVRATAVTSSDTFIRGFRLKPSLWIPGRLALGLTRPRRPVLGMVFAGRVDAVAPGVAAWQVGQRVYGFDRFGFGCYAQLKTLPADGVLAPSPVNLDDEEAAALPYGGLLAWSFLKGRLRAGQEVLVYGASGAVGTAAVQLARAEGARVTAMCGPAHLDLVAGLGADRVIDYRVYDVTAGPDRFDVVFVAVGNRVGPPSRRDCRGILAPDGTYLAVDRGRPAPGADDLRLLTRRAEAGQFRPVIDRRYPLAELAQAHRYVEGGHKAGNVVISVGVG